MSTWMLYALAIGFLLWLAGHCAERVALAAGRGTRWIWLLAIAASTAVPLLLPAWNARYGRVAPDSGGGPAIGVSEVVGGIAPIEIPDAGMSAWLERALALGWGAASVALLVFFVVSTMVLRRRRRAWPLRVIAGMPVLVSERTGPALVGFAVPHIVVPAWVLEWDEQSLRLLVAHEREHERAGDPLLLLAAAASLVLLPWNLPLWWQVRRLRLAIEVDCDARVLRRHPDARRYGLLLLEVGALASRAVVPVAAFSEPSSLLERRMRVLSGERRIRRAAAVAFVSAALAGPAAVLALPVPDPPAVPARAATPAPPPIRASADPVAQSWQDAGAAGRAIDTIPDPDRPGVVPYDTAPGLLPQAPGTGDEPPAADQPHRVPVYTSPPAGRFGQDAAPDTVELAARPTFTPYEVRPALKNRAEFSRIMEDALPQMPRGAGIEATAVHWVYIRADGTVGAVRLAQSSGYPAVDAAASEVLMRAEFTPAMNRGRAVPVWIQLPATFQAR